MNLFKALFTHKNRWISCSERLPKSGDIVKIKYKQWEGIGYVSPFNGLWQDLRANAMTTDFDRGIRVEFWKEKF